MTQTPSDEDKTRTPDAPPGDAALVDEFWPSLIEPGETILWAGAPEVTETARATHPLMLGLYGMGIVVGAGLLLRHDGGVLIHAIGMVMAVLCGLQFARTLKPGQSRFSDMHYALSDKAAYIAYLRAGKPPHVQRQEIRPLIPVSGTATTVQIVTGMSRGGRDRSPSPIFFGFYNIPDAPAVREMIRTIQRGIR